MVTSMPKDAQSIASNFMFVGSMAMENKEENSIQQAPMDVDIFGVTQDSQCSLEENEANGMHVFQ